MSHPLRPQRLMAMLAVVGITAGGALALPSVARADGDTWRDGWCRKGDGQSVVIDWRFHPDAVEGESRDIIRCILLTKDATKYPLAGELSPLTDPLESAGIPYVVDELGIVTSINGQSFPTGFSWQWSTGQVAPDGASGTWLGKSKWEPLATVDSVVGITLTDKPSDPSKGLPVVLPQYNPAKPDPPEVDPPEVDPPEVDPPEVDPPKVDPPKVDPPKVDPPKVDPPATPPSNAATATPTTTATATSTQRPSRTSRPDRPPRRTTRPQRPTNRPQPPVNPPPFIPPEPPIQNFPELPPIEDPLLPPPEDGSGQATDFPNPTPSRVWGREDATREGSAAIRSDAPTPWSQLAAVAGAVVIVGGLGTAFARGLQTSAPPVVEEE